MDYRRDKVRPKKHLGQHFLTDMTIAERIVGSLKVDWAGVGGAGGTGCVSDQVGVGGVCAEGGEYKGFVVDEGGVGACCVADGAEVVVDKAAGNVANEGVGGKGCAAEADNKAIKAETISPKNKVDVLEVGPGTGVLTQYLLKRKDITLYATEVDTESIEYLNNHYPELGDRLMEQDFLKMDLAEKFPGGLSIIGNFPYNISSQIFFKVLDDRDLVPEVVGMIQREVAVRIAEKPGTRDYGILSVFLQAYYNIEYLFTVDENVFNPPPRVKSAVIRLTRNNVEKLDCDEKLFRRVVKATFNQRRKTIRNSLRAGFADLGDDQHRFFALRPETLGVEEFVELTNWVAQRIEQPTEVL